ncbi:Stereocilin [Bagarius yarrelli]|uniref:Stereocilin n=1 Tax=Bagarius yarrelli TaxID=175774 RepID=A0A556V3V8_BAGYA|nr:Stereocilin [Bagarius yarrelli]
MTDLALCADLDTANFIHKVCGNVTVLQNLLANLDNTWLLKQCSNLTGSGKDNLMGFKPSEQCRYTDWMVTLPDASLLALCWDYDQANFISSICLKPAALSHIVQYPANLWVSALCATCFNNTRGTLSNNTDGQSNTTEAHPCLVKEMIVRLNWSCSIDLNTICQPGISQVQVVQAFLRCGGEVLLPRMEKTMTTEVASMVKQATSLWVILLIVLEENQMTTLKVIDNIRQSVLDSVSVFLKEETSFSKKQVLLQCFAQYFQIPLARLRAVLSSVDMNTMRLILHYYNRNHENLQLTEDYLRTLVSVLIKTHLRRDEALLLDLSPLLRLAKPEDINTLPPLQNNLIVLNLMNDTISSLSVAQRQAFGSWFGRSLDVVNMTAGGPSFIRDCGNLIAYLPFRSFQHLSPAQVLNGLDVLLRNELGAVKQQFVAQRVFGVYKNLTTDDFRRLSTLTCQASMSDLLAYVNTSAFPVIQENIRTCVAQGTYVPSNMISSLFYSNGSELHSPAALSSEKISQLAQLLPRLGAGFLQQLNQSQLVPAFSALTSVRFTPTQAKTLFNKITSSESDLTTQRFRSLGTVAQGVSCNILSKLFQSSVSASSGRDLLQVLRQQPVPLHPSLKRCLMDEMYKSNFFTELLGEMGAQIALSIPISTIKKFSPVMMDSLRKMVVLEPQYFLLMPRIKQSMLVEKMVQSLGLNTGLYTEEEFRSLGVMATFVMDTVFQQLDRRFLVDSIEFLQGFCYNSSKGDIVAAMLQEDDTFGPVQNWNSTTLIQVDRFLFFLPQKIIQQIPPAVMSLERLERLFSRQQQWESRDVGTLCQSDPETLLSRKQFMFQYFSGSPNLERASLSASSTPPSCDSVQLTGLTVYGAVSSFTPSVIAQLGRIATQLSLDELASLKLSEILSIAPLGAVSTWTRKQLGVLFSTILNTTKQTPRQLNSSSLVALGHIVCGIEAPVIDTLNPVEFSKAVLWLGRLNLSCSEDQLQAVVSLLSTSLVFGPISTWGPEGVSRDRIIRW